MSARPTPHNPQRFLPHYDKNGIDCGMCKHADLHEPRPDVSRMVCLRHKWQLSVQFVRDHAGDCGPNGQWFERSVL